MSVCMCMEVYVYQISYVFLTEGFLKIKEEGIRHLAGCPWAWVMMGIFIHF